MGRSLGLALSGGGFRASFFHVGVLACLADAGRLRDLEVLSTVSGGSIVGALYYLRVKALLEAKADADVTDADYVALVQDVAESLRALVQRNLRMRTFASLRKNLRMAVRDDYSRGDRMGELLDELLYAPAYSATGKKPGRSAVEMRDLLIRPKWEEPGFKPFLGNPRRRAKVPVLRLNATSLNSGHNWRFEAVTMGEPAPDGTWRAIDKNARFERREAYGEAGPQADFPLGIAVAASASVPVLFPPVAVSGLHAERVQLVDGGVHDNQGVRGLTHPIGEGRALQQLVVSDASGQLKDAPKAPTTLVGVLKRTLDVYEDRLREEQLIHLSTPPHKATIVHLRSGLAARRLPVATAQRAPPAPGVDESDASSTAFGVDPNVQDALSLLRTDLDAFSDAEAHALAFDGYVMVQHALAKDGEDAPKLDDEALRARWPFWAVKEAMARPPPQFLEHLRNGSRSTAKLLYQDRLTQGIVAAFALTLFVGAPFALAGLGWVPLGLGLGASAILAASIALLVAVASSEAVQDALVAPARFLLKGASLVGAFFFWIAASAWRWANRRYLQRGRLDALGVKPR